MTISTRWSHWPDHRPRRGADKDAFPTRAVYGDLDHAGLRLITCGGVFDRTKRRYVDNLIVFAESVPATSTEQMTR